jgi:hypothetical protein
MVKGKMYPLLGNGNVNMFPKLSMHVTAVTSMNATTEELLGEVFSIWSA